MINRLDRTSAAAAKSLQSCRTLCDPIDGCPPGFPIPGILQARTLEWVAISFSNAWKWKVKEKSLSCVRLSETPWTAANQAPPSMGFSRQEYWSGVPLPSQNKLERTDICKTPQYKSVEYFFFQAHREHLRYCLPELKSHLSRFQRTEIKIKGPSSFWPQLS